MNETWAKHETVPEYVKVLLYALYVQTVIFCCFKKCLFFIAKWILQRGEA